MEHESDKWSVGQYDHSQSQEIGLPNNSLIRLAIISPYPPNEDSNALWAKLYAEHMEATYCNISILIIAGEDLNKNHTRAASYRERLKVRFIWNRNQRASLQLRNIIRELKEFNPDVVHIHYNYFTFGNLAKSYFILIEILRYCKKNRKKTVVTLHSVVRDPLKKVIHDKLGLTNSFPLPEALARELYAGMIGKIISQANHTAIPSRTAFHYLSQILDRKLSHKFSVIPLGFDTINSHSNKTQINPDSREMQVASLFANGPIISYVGLIAPYKGIDRLVKIFLKAQESLHDLNLLIAGKSYSSSDMDGASGKSRNYYSRIEILLTQTGTHSKIRIVNRYLTSNEIETIMTSSDLVIFPFVNDGIISFASSVYNALFLPTKILITDSPRLSEFIGIEGVYLVGDDAPDKFSSQIHLALQARAPNMKMRLEQLRDHFVENVCGRYLEIYSKKN